MSAAPAPIIVQEQNIVQTFGQSKNLIVEISSQANIHLDVQAYVEEESFHYGKWLKIDLVEHSRQGIPWKLLTRLHMPTKLAVLSGIKKVDIQISTFLLAHLRLWPFLLGPAVTSLRTGSSLLVFEPFVSRSICFAITRRFLMTTMNDLFIEYLASIEPYSKAVKRRPGSSR